MRCYCSVFTNSEVRHFHERRQRKAIDCFVNSVYLFDDYALITCKFKEGTTKITLDDIENSDFRDFLKGQKNKPEQECSGLFEVGEPYVGGGAFATLKEKRSRITALSVGIF